ncbi:PPP6R2 family protein [Megaselia abdita]
MFWDKAYVPSANLEALLVKEDATVEEFLDLEDIIQECKTQHRNIVHYFTRPDVIKRLIELCITEPPENENFSQRFKHANMACEILTFGLPSVEEKIVEDTELLNILYSYLENEPPLNPLLSSFFSKTISMLLTKTSDKDWFLYQKTCLQLLEYLKSRENFIDLIILHFCTPVIPDLIMQMLRELKGAPLKKYVFEWLAENKLIERLISELGNPDESDKHRNIADFLCEIILSGREMRQTEQDSDSFEPAFIGSNPLLEIIESQDTIQLLCDVILKENAKESTIVFGIYVVLTLIEEYLIKDCSSERAQFNLDKERETQKIVVQKIINVFAPNFERFHEFLLNPPVARTIQTTTGVLAPPFGQTRLQICRLARVLLTTGNETMVQAICKTDFMVTLLNFFKEYCWNNFLHEEVEKCLEHIFYYKCTGLDSTILNSTATDINGTMESDQNLENEIKVQNFEENGGGGQLDTDHPIDNPKTTQNTNEITSLQDYVIVKCKLISKLVDLWLYNREKQSCEKGRRLGYMGHLIRIFDHVVIYVNESETIGALIENNLTESDLEQWKLIINSENGEFSIAKQTQERHLANCNVNDSSDMNASLPREIYEKSDNCFLVKPFVLSNYFRSSDDILMSESDEQLFEQLGQNIFSSSLLNDNTVPLDLRQLNIYGNLDDDDEVMDEDDDNNTTSQDKFFYASNYNPKDRRLFEGFLHNFPSSDSSSTNRLNSLSINVNPWGDHKSSSDNDDEQEAQENDHQQQQPVAANCNIEDPFKDHFQVKTGTDNDDGFQFANFADFDKFCDNNFSSSMGEEEKSKDEVFMTEFNSDRNANIEKISTKDTIIESSDDVAAADTPSNTAFPSANNISKDDTLDLDGSDTMLNGTYEDSEENIESNFNM